MVHAFKCNGKYFALDVDTGSLHMLDKLAFAVVLLYEQLDAEAIAQRLTMFDEKEVLNAISEVEELKKQGKFFTNMDYEDEFPEQPSGVIKSMCLHIAHDCNLKCRYCFASAGSYKGPKGLMSYETGKKALDFLIEKSGGRKQLEVDFFGGEPTLNMDVVKRLVEYGRELEKKHDKIIRFTITTNAYELDDETIAFINKEMKNVVISIDGRKHVHDKMRPSPSKQGTYDKVLQNALKLVKGRGDKEYYIRGTYTRENLDFADDVLAIVEQGFDQVSIEPVVLKKTSPLAIKESDMPKVLAEYDRLLDIYLESKREGCGFNFFHFNIDLTGGPCIKKRVSGCGAGVEYIAVTPEGDIYPCHQFVGQTEYRMEASIQGKLISQFPKKCMLQTS